MDYDSILDTLLLYLYQTIVLVALAAGGFIFYLFRTRAPLKEAPVDEKFSKNGTLNTDYSLSDDELLLRSALLDDQSIMPQASQAPKAPVMVPHAPAPMVPKSNFAKRIESEEEEEEEESPVLQKRPAMRMVTTRQGVQEINQSMNDHPFISAPYPYPDALKNEARQKIGQALQKKQVMEWIGTGEFDEAITNIRSASQRLQNSGF